jgi:hypothetical protein
MYWRRGCAEGALGQPQGWQSQSPFRPESRHAKKRAARLVVTADGDSFYVWNAKK